jgi:bifunctional oligoribonuclease and PAP phosphatase NrnA
MIQKQILAMIKQYETIIIHHHLRPDPDCIGSQLGLKYILEEAFPNKKIYAVGNHTERTEFLGSLDQVTDEVYQDALVIMVDVGDKTRIADDRFLNGRALIKIDHHPLTESFADLEWVDPSFAACAEMIIEFANENNAELSLNEKAARVLYAGLLTDTGRFYFNSVSGRTLRYAALAYDYGFDKQALYANLYYASVDELKFNGFIMENFQYTPNGLGYLKINQAILDHFNIKAEFASGQVNALSNIKEIEMWMFFTEDCELGKIRTSFRSRGPIVNELAAKYGGGGHKMASGALLDNWDVVEAVIKDADQICLNYKS